ncbi:hypothetical protein [Mesorhizobium sp. M0955]
MTFRSLDDRILVRRIEADEKTASEASPFPTSRRKSCRRAK